MKLTKWKIKDEIFQFPSNWDKTKVLTFVNANMNICEHCGKIDILNNHYSNCDPISEQYKQMNEDNYWK